MDVSRYPAIGSLKIHPDVSTAKKDKKSLHGHCFMQPSHGQLASLQRILIKSICQLEKTDP